MVSSSWPLVFGAHMARENDPQKKDSDLVATWVQNRRTIRYRDVQSQIICKDIHTDKAYYETRKGAAVAVSQSLAIQIEKAQV